MGAIGGLLGLSGGVNGTGRNLGTGVTGEQLGTSYNNAQSALGSQQQLVQALQNQGGLNNQSQVYNQLQGVANGTGPNPAQAMLNNTTGANVANQAALMAGQRGAGANVGLLARQAAQQGANTQQQAIGQGAALQANQSLNALGQAGNIANTQAANQIGATGTLNQAAQGEQGILQGANSAMNTNQASIAGATAQAQGQLLGGVLGGAGVGAALPKAEGGTITYAEGGPTLGVDTNLASATGQNTGGSFFGKFANGVQSAAPQPQAVPQKSPLERAGNAIGSGLAKGVGALFGAQGGNVGSKLKSGGGVPGKAKVEGNSYANDNVKALLSPGEGVIDRETMNDPGPVGQHARFVMAYVNSKKGRK